MSEVEARRVTVRVVTAADRTLVEADAARLGIRHLLGEITGSCTDKASQLEAVGERNGGRIAFVGDTVHDVEHARAPR